MNYLHFFLVAECLLRTVRSLLLITKMGIIIMEIHFMITFYVFTHRDVSAAQISHAMMSRKMKRTFLAFPVRVNRTIHPSFILHFTRASFRRSTSLRRGNS